VRLNYQIHRAEFFCTSAQQCPWLVHLADKLLSGDPVTAQLLGPNGNPFNATLAVDPRQQGQIAAKTPTFVRAELYEVCRFYIFCWGALM
jgi:hypothetical protein